MVDAFGMHAFKCVNQLVEVKLADAVWESLPVKVLERWLTVLKYHIRRVSLKIEALDLSHVRHSFDLNQSVQILPKLLVILAFFEDFQRPECVLFTDENGVA